MKRALIALFLLCYSCGIGDPLPPAGIDEELYPYYERFMIDLAVRRLPLKAHVRSIRWTDKDLGGNVIGVCTIWQSSFGPEVYTYRTVKISVSMAESSMLGTLVYHELAHCMLDLCHSTNPDDIMYYTINYPLTKESIDNMLGVYARGEQYDDCD